MRFKQQLCCPIPDTARPCRGGASALPWRDRTVAAFNFPTTTADTECTKRKCDGSMVANGSMVRRGHGSSVVFPALLSRARETWPETICLAPHRSRNLANGGAQAAPGSAAADSLPSQAAPALPISRDLSADPEARRRAEIGSIETPPPHEGSAAGVDGELLQGRVPLRRTSGEFATSEAAGLCPEIAARGNADGATRPRWYALGLCAASNKQDPQSAGLRDSETRCALPPRDRTGGQCGREDIRDKRGNARLWKSPMRSPGALPIRAISQ